jgi:hypothetical protein
MIPGTSPEWKLRLGNAMLVKYGVNATALGGLIMVHLWWSVTAVTQSTLVARTTNKKPSPLRGRGHEDAHQMSKIVDDSEDGLREEATLTRYVNTTPHAINILAGSDINRGEADVTIESSNVSIRVKSESEVECLTIVGSLFVEIRKRKFTSVTYLEDGVEMPMPNQQRGVTYIVSRITAEALPNRVDLLMVDGTVRDDDGRIIGCTGFAQL